MANNKDKHVFKGAVTRKHYMTQFIELDQRKPLAAIIEKVCNVWKLSNPENYELRFDSPENDAVVTERNRSEIKDGFIIGLFDSPVKAAHNILADIQSSSNEKKISALEQLAKLAEDDKFAGNFVNKNGVPVLIKMVESNSFSGVNLGNLLSSICDLLSHGHVSWDVFEDSFIKQVATNILKPSGVDVRVLQASLEILENIAINGTSNHAMVEKLITPVTLLAHLQSPDQDVQKNTIALINALLKRSSVEQRKKYAESLQQKSFRNTIMQHVIRSKTLSEDMWMQLHTLQSLLFDFLHELRRTPVNLNDNQADKNLNLLRQTAFENETGTSRSPATHARRRSHVAEFKKLGFEDSTDPLKAFTVVPPGCLALQTMTYFSQHHSEEYAKIVCENSSRADNHDLPFARACIALTELLCEILHIGQQPNETHDSRFCPMFFTSEYPFEELFCECVGLINKTWKEMRATLADFSKVMSVVKEQITRALKERHNSYVEFKIHLNKLTYSEITRLWQAELREKEDWASQARPIKELRQQLEPEIYELIKQQRLNFLVEGSRFKHNKRSKEKYWYCKLTPNHKALLYYECDDQGEMIGEQAEKKLAVEDFKYILSGKDCPHVKDNPKARKNTQTVIPFAFSIVTDKEIEVISEKEIRDPPSLNFMALTEEEQDRWVDGLHTLLNQQMVSKCKKEEMDILLGMEIKLRLLDTEGLTIPESPPAIPADPPNYNFHYKT